MLDQTRMNLLAAIAYYNTLLLTTVDKFRIGRWKAFDRHPIVKGIIVGCEAGPGR